MVSRVPLKRVSTGIDLNTQTYVCLKERAEDKEEKEVKEAKKLLGILSISKLPLRSNFPSRVAKNSPKPSRSPSSALLEWSFFFHSLFSSLEEEKNGVKKKFFVLSVRFSSAGSFSVYRIM